MILLLKMYYVINITVRMDQGAGRILTEGHGDGNS